MGAPGGAVNVRPHGMHPTWVDNGLNSCGPPRVHFGTSIGKSFGASGYYAPDTCKLGGDLTGWRRRRQHCWRHPKSGCFSRWCVALLPSSHSYHHDGESWSFEGAPLGAPASGRPGPMLATCEAHGRLAALIQPIQTLSPLWTGSYKPWGGVGGSGTLSGAARKPRGPVTPGYSPSLQAVTTLHAQLCFYKCT